MQPFHVALESLAVLHEPGELFRLTTCAQYGVAKVPRGQRLQIPVALVAKAMRSFCENEKLEFETGLHRQSVTGQTLQHHSEPGAGAERMVTLSGIDKLTD